MSMFGRALGKGASAFVSGAGKVGKALDTTPRKAGRNLKAAMKNVARDPAKLKRLGKKVAKYGAAGAAGYGLAKMMKSED